MKNQFWVCILTLCAALCNASPYYGWVNEYTGSEPNTLGLWNFNQNQIQNLAAGTIAKEVVRDSNSSYQYGFLSNALGATCTYNTGGKFGWGAILPYADQNLGDQAVNYVQVSNPTDMSRNAIWPNGSDPSLSVECWFKLDQLDARVHYIIDHMYTTHEGYMLALQHNAAWPLGKYRLWWSVGNGNSGTYPNDLYTFIDLTDWQANRWYHVAGTWDAKTRAVYLYRDGVLVNDHVYAGAAPIVNGTLSLRIGERQSSTYAQGFGGAIDGVRISNTAYSYAVPPVILGDLNGDGKVDFSDIQMFSLDWLICTDPDNAGCSGGTGYRKGDLNKDYYVNFVDFALLAEDWATGN